MCHHPTDVMILEIMLPLFLSSFDYAIIHYNVFDVSEVIVGEGK